MLDVIDMDYSEPIDKFTEKRMPDEVFNHEDKFTQYEDTIIYYAPKSKKECENEDYSPHTLENMIGVVRKIVDKDGVETDSVAYFIESIYDVYLSGNVSDDTFKRYIEDIYEPKSIRSMTNNESKDDWFKFLNRCKRINETKGNINFNDPDDNTTTSGCSSDLRINGEIENKFPKIFD